MNKDLIKDLTKLKIKSLDHLVLTVSNINNTCEFYKDILGMEVVNFSGRKALLFGNQKINLHKVGAEFLPNAKKATVGSADLCFITEIPLKQAIKYVKSKGIEIIEESVTRTGAVGEIVSFYFRDIDGNLIEVSNYI